MSTLTDFLIVHQSSLGPAYTPLMTIYLFFVLSPIWSIYLLLCALVSLLPDERFLHYNPLHFPFGFQLTPCLTQQH